MFGWDPENKIRGNYHGTTGAGANLKKFKINSPYLKKILEIQAIILEKIRIYSEKLYEMDSVPNLFKIF